MGILDSAIGSIVGSVVGPRVGGSSVAQGSRGLQPFKSYVQVEDGDGAYNTQAEVYGAIGGAGVWATIWERTIPAQQEWRWGAGSAGLPQNQGYMWFAIMDSGTDFSIGTLRLVQQNANRTRKLVVYEIPDSQLHSTTNTNIGTAALIDKNQMIALPEKVTFPRVGEDSLVGLEYNLVTAATAADAAGFRIPMTKYY